MDFISFATLRSKMSETLIPILFWLLVLIGVGLGNKIIETGGLWLGLVLMILVALIARIFCEALLSIHEIANSLKSNKS